MNTETAISKFSEIQTNYSVNTDNTILHQVGDTSITAKGDCVIIKAGGVEVVIDSKGLLVKGGEIKSERESKWREKQKGNKGMKVLGLLLCGIVCYAWGISNNQGMQSTKSVTQTIQSLDSVLENLINVAKLDSLNSLTQEECKKLQHAYSTNLQDSQNDNEAYREEQSCYYAAIHSLRTKVAELITKKHINTDIHSLDSILHYKIIAFLSTENIQALHNVLGFEVAYYLQDVINVCHRLDGLEFEATCNLYMQIFDDLARYTAQEHKLTQKQMQDYYDTFEIRTQNALNLLEQELPNLP
ncbi:hypothetical protein [Helicobacter typhlonius]|uniref:hypothetical protein n=1 Tax=Helicobacter typhlonius TaxID=76936 RepID=UPI002FE3A8A5